MKTPRDRWYQGCVGWPPKASRTREKRRKREETDLQHVRNVTGIQFQHARSRLQLGGEGGKMKQSRNPTESAREPPSFLVDEWEEDEGWTSEIV